jgi:hypothetical protein
MKDPQALEERERLFDPGRCIFGCSSSISRLDTYPVCYFMDLARSDECILSWIQFVGREKMKCEWSVKTRHLPSGQLSVACHKH